jgi:hypothetical protein
MILFLFLTHGAQSVSHKAGETTFIGKNFHLSSQVKHPSSWYLKADSSLDLTLIQTFQFQENPVGPAKSVLA